MRGGQEERNSWPLLMCSLGTGACLGMRKERGGLESGGQASVAPHVVGGKSIVPLST